MAGQGAAAGAYPEYIDHYSVLRTIEDFYGLSPLAAGDAGLSGENWTVVRAESFAANFASENPLPGLVPGIHVSSRPGSPRQRRGWPDHVRARGSSLVAQDRGLATASGSPDSP